MALNIKNPEVERLARMVAAATGETLTEAIRRALQERHARVRLGVTGRDRSHRLERFLETEVWPRVPDGERGRRWTRDEVDDLLGFDEHGV